MSGWLDDFVTLMFKHALLAKEQAAEVIKRYLGFVKRATLILVRPLAASVLLFVICAAVGVKSPWLYEILVLLIAGLLLALIVVALPLLILSQALYEMLPQALQNAARAWQRRGGIILFCALVAVFVIRAFRLWQSPEKMITVLAVVMLLWVGGVLGWLTISHAWRRVLATKLWITLILVAIVTLLPGPAGLVEELADWTGDRFEGAVFRVTRATPERYYPTSADELQTRFVDKGTGKFLLWYFRDQRGDYQFYRSKGFDEYGAPLKQAVSPTEFGAIVAWQSTKDLERKAASLAAKAEADQREKDAQIAEEKRLADEDRKKKEDQVAAEKRLADEDRKKQEDQVAADKLKVEQEKTAERARLASYTLAIPTEKVRYIVFVIDQVDKPSSEITSAVVSRLVGKGIGADGSVFSEAFVCPQGFDAVFAGKGGAALAGMGISNVADRLLLIRGSDPKSSQSSTMSGVRTYSMRMTIAVIDAHNGAILSQFTIGDVTGAGVTDAAATSAFVDRFAEQLAARGEVLDVPK